MPKINQTEDLASRSMVSINYSIPDEIHKAIRILAAEQGVTIKELVIEGLNLVLEKYGKK